MYDAIGYRSRTQIKAQDDVLGLEIPDPDFSLLCFYGPRGSDSEIARTFINLTLQYTELVLYNRLVS